jgi:hypothetical protein
MFPWLASAKAWLVPPAVSHAAGNWLAMRRLPAADRALLSANRALHGRHAGRRAFILCSGPSIKTQDLTVLKNEICIGVSNFFVHPEYATIGPRYHCIAPLHPPFTDDDGLRWFRTMEQPLEGRELFLALTDRHLVETGRLFSATQIHYLAFGRPWGKSAPPPLALDERLPSGQSVSIFALMVALQLGFSEIYLLGTDHTSLNFQNGQYAYQHFYTGARTNALGEIPPPPDLEPEFAGYVALWRQYKTLRTIAAARGVQIFNATRGGLLDVFPRVTLESLFPSPPDTARKNPSP